MITAGVDLSASPPKTAIASVAWVDGEGARLLTLRERADDEAIVDAVRSADKTGIDCPRAPTVSGSPRPSPTR
jgi:predicted nuclease with RNAse H fold